MPQAALLAAEKKIGRFFAVSPLPKKPDAAPAG